MLRKSSATLFQVSRDHFSFYQITFKLFSDPLVVRFFSVIVQFMLTLIALLFPYFNCSVISAKQQTCPTGEFWCDHDWKCILRRKVCDGTEDCSNGQDEKECGM